MRKMMRGLAVRLGLVVVGFSLSLFCVSCQNGAPAAPSPSGTAPAAQKPVFFGPYVTAVTPTAATIQWVTPASGGGSCRLIGDSAGAKVAIEITPIVGRSDVRHAARVTGLKADEMQRYVVEYEGRQIEGRFRTPPGPGKTGKDFCFVITGDTQSYALRVQQVAEMMAREEPAFFVHTGDLCNNTQHWPTLEETFFGPCGGFLRQAPIWVIRGNHEQANEPFASLFGLPSTEDWQSMDFGPVHVVCLDQWSLRENKEMEPERMAAMLAWLDKDLAAAKARGQWILVGGHQPMFNVAGHGSTWGHETVLPLLYKYGVDVVFAGHSHLYERFIPIGPAGGKPIQFLVTGGGGGQNYPSAPSPLLIRSFPAPHFTLYRVFDNRLEITIRGSGGEYIDSFSLLRNPDGTRPQRYLDDSITVEDAMRLLKGCNRVSVEANDRPVAGQPLVCGVSPALFPAGAKVTISSDPGSPWTVKETTFEGVSPADANVEIERVPMTVIPPTGVLMGEGQGFSPMLTVAVAIEFRGRHYSCIAVPVGLTSKTTHRLAPEPEVVAVPPAAGEIVLDGSLAEWKNVPFLRMPSTGKASRSIKLAWRSDGLYGAVVVEQSGGLHTDPTLPWNGDSLEINMESDARGRTRGGTPGVPVKVFLWPREGDDPNAGLLRQTGSLPGGGVRCVWQKTASGYTLEFRISSKALTTPAEADILARRDLFRRTLPLEKDRQIGLDIYLRHNGEVLEHFADNSAFRSTWNTPLGWGRIVLAEK